MGHGVRERKISGGTCIVHPENPRLVLSTSRSLWPWSGWALVGGKAEEGEDAVQAALRETFEETGITLTSADLAAAYRAELDGWDATFFLVRPAVEPKFRRFSQEGWVAWMPVTTILKYEPFYEYNKALFNEFGLMSGDQVL